VFTNNQPPVVTSTTLTTIANTQASVTLNSSDPNGNSRTLRIVRQPQHGAVSLTGTTATYHPEADFTGPDSFTFAAFDGFADSKLGTVSITVGNPATIGTLDRDGDQIPDLVEYALGLSPDFPTADDIRSPFYQTLGQWDYWTLRIPRGPSPSDASAVIEFSSDLNHWVPGVVISNTPFLLEARDPNPGYVDPKRFVRVRAQR
jgi:hypothetical protein